MRYQRLIVAGFAALTVGSCLQFTSLADEAATPDEHPLKPAIRYAQACLERVEALPGYEATFFKKEVVGTTTISQKMTIKVRHNPFSVYLYFHSPHEGREVIYVEGENNG